MAICMKLSPHVCEDSCQPSPSQVSMAGNRRGRSRRTTVVAIRLPDGWAQKLKSLAAKSGEGSVNDYLRRLVETQALRKR